MEDLHAVIRETLALSLKMTCIAKINVYIGYADHVKHAAGYCDG